MVLVYVVMLRTAQIAQLIHPQPVILVVVDFSEMELNSVVQSKTVLTVHQTLLTLVMIVLLGMAEMAQRPVHFVMYLFVMIAQRTHPQYVIRVVVDSLEMVLGHAVY